MTSGLEAECVGGRYWFTWGAWQADSQRVGDVAVQSEWEKGASWEVGAVLYCDLGDSCTGVYMYTYIRKNSSTVHLKFMYFVSVIPHKRSCEKKKE